MINNNIIEQCPSFHVNINSIDDIREILTVAKKCGIWMVEYLKEGIINNWEDYDGLCIVIDLYQNTNNADDYVKSLDEVILFPKLYYTDLNEGTYETLNKENFIDIIENYKTNERLVKLLNSKKEYLSKLLGEHPSLYVGAEIVTDISWIEPPKIKGYTLITGQWFIETTSGYSSFNKTKIQPT